MTPTSKAEGVRERAQRLLDSQPQCAPNCDGDLVGIEHDEDCPCYGKPDLTTVDLLAAFAESEALLARKEEREAILKIVRNSGVEAGTWGEEAVRDEIASEIRKRSQEEGR